MPRLWAGFWFWVLSAPVRAKIMGIAVGTMFVLGLVVTLYVRATLVDRMRGELEQRGGAVARDVAGRAAELIVTDNLFALQELARTTMENNDDVRYVFVVSRDRRLLAQTFGEHFPQDLLRVNSEVPAGRLRVQVLETEEGLVHDVAAPVLDGEAGVARVGMSETRLNAMARGTTWLLLSVSALVSNVGVAAAFLLTLVLTKPILELVEVTRAVGRGDFSRKAPVWAADEIGRLSIAFNAMTEALAQAREDVRRKDELRRQLLDKVMLAQEEERKRVARELHDEVGQSLTALIMSLGSAEETLPTELQPLRDQLAQLRGLTANTLEEIRRLMRDLRPTLLDDLGLVPAIQWYAETNLARVGIDASVQVTGSRRRLPPTVETTLFRVVQEAITNVVKHAEAREATVLLVFEDGSINATIEDDGKGFRRRDLEGGRGFGLLGMEERVTLLGGRLQIDSKRGRGTRIAIEIPLPENSGESTVDVQVRLMGERE